MGEKKATKRTSGVTSKDPAKPPHKKVAKIDRGHRTTPEEHAFRLACWEAVAGWMKSRPVATRRKYGPVVTGRKTLETPHITLQFDAMKLGKKFSWAFIRPMLHKDDETVEADFYIVVRSRNRKNLRLEILKRGNKDFEYEAKSVK